MSDIDVEMRDPPNTMFGAPRWSPDETYDVVFVGVPSDTGGFGSRTPASAPAFLRNVSQLFPFHADATHAGRGVGWFDFVARRTILEGVRLADAGDFPWTRRRGAEQFEALPAVYETLRQSARLVVVLGGDHSNAFWLAKALHDEGLVWVDAHDDATSKKGPYPHCGNVTSYIEELTNVPAIAQFGVRGLIPAIRRPAAHRSLVRDAAEARRALAERGLARAAVSIDIDVLDPSIMPAVGSPMPGGLRVEDVETFLRELVASGVRVPMLELAEFAPATEADGTAGLLVVNFLLRAIALCLDAEGATQLRRS